MENFQLPINSNWILWCSGDCLKSPFWKRYWLPWLRLRGKSTSLMMWIEWAWICSFEISWKHTAKYGFFPIDYLTWLKILVKNSINSNPALNDLLVKINVEAICFSWNFNLYISRLHFSLGLKLITQQSKNMTPFYSNSILNVFVGLQ